VLKNHENLLLNLLSSRTFSIQNTSQQQESFWRHIYRCCTHTPTQQSHFQNSNSHLHLLFPFLHSFKPQSAYILPHPLAFSRFYTFIRTIKKSKNTYRHTQNRLYKLNKWMNLKQRQPVSQNEKKQTQKLILDGAVRSLMCCWEMCNGTK
jgi:hypothetical protein